MLIFSCRGLTLKIYLLALEDDLVLGHKVQAVEVAAAVVAPALVEEGELLRPSQGKAIGSRLCLAETVAWIAKENLDPEGIYCSSYMLSIRIYIYTFIYFLICWLYAVYLLIYVYICCLCAVYLLICCCLYTVIYGLQYWLFFIFTLLHNRASLHIRRTVF